jgi:hypothetical protein
VSATPFTTLQTCHSERRVALLRVVVEEPATLFAATQLIEPFSHDGLCVMLAVFRPLVTGDQLRIYSSDIQVSETDAT